MDDDDENGARPVGDAAVPDPPTVDEDPAGKDRREREGEERGGVPAPQADPTYDLPGDNPLAAEDDDD